MRVGLIQLCSGEDRDQNIETVTRLVRSAAQDGADCIFTPEVTNFLSPDRALQARVLQPESEDQALAALCDLANELDVWLNIGSLALQSDTPDGKFLNRSFIIRPDGSIAARFDKIHMFDVDISDSVRLRESEAYQRGHSTVVCDTGHARLGLTICYDLRFPHLYRDLAHAGAQVLTCPSAFTVPSGQAHWHTLLRARAIENGAFVIAAAQTGVHPTDGDKTRESFGHSLVVDPWGMVLLDAKDQVGAFCVDLDISLVDETRKRIPSIQHDQPYDKPINV